MSTHEQSRTQALARRMAPVVTALFCLSLGGCRAESQRSAPAVHVAAPVGAVARACVTAAAPVRALPLQRPIADVMGYQGAEWLDRADRDETDKPDDVVRALAIAPGAHVADVGAGTGYFTFRLAVAVGATGQVLALDVQPEMLDALRAKVKARATNNVMLVQTTPTDLGLFEASLDLALLVDVYHELAQPLLALAQLRCALRPGARLAFVEYRGEDPTIEIKPEHKMTVAELRREVEHAGFQWLRTDEFLPHQHVVLFTRPAT